MLRFKGTGITILWMMLLPRVWALFNGRSRRGPSLRNVQTGLTDPHDQWAYIWDMDFCCRPGRCGFHFIPWSFPLSKQFLIPYIFVWISWSSMLSTICIIQYLWTILTCCYQIVITIDNSNRSNQPPRYDSLEWFNLFSESWSWCSRRRISTVLSSSNTL